MTTKQQELKRLLLFLLLAFSIAWIPEIIFSRIFTFEAWFLTNKMPALKWPVLFAPALANLLTRLITKEGMRDSKLTLRLHGCLKYYIIALVLPILLDILIKAFIAAVFGREQYAYELPRLKEVLPQLLLGYATAPLMLLFTFGEEFGWRGYMNPKLERLGGKPISLLAGGMIWGLWYAPLVISGLEFGKNYNGYPFLGIAVTCLICIVTGTILTWLTDRTGSIIPACIMHAMLCYQPSFISDFFLKHIA